MIHKHEIPILEFDDNPQAVIMPTHEDLDLNLPARCVYAFLEEESLLGSSSSWISCSCTISGLVDWLWRKANHINWNLWCLGRHAREYLLDSDESIAR